MRRSEFKNVETWKQVKGDPRVWATVDKKAGSPASVTLMQGHSFEDDSHVCFGSVGTIIEALNEAKRCSAECSCWSIEVDDDDDGTKNPLRDKVSRIADSVKARWVERDELVDGLVLSLLSGADLLAIGVPGCAKSAVIKDFLAHLDMKKFSRQLNQYSTDKDLLGDINPKRFMESGERIHAATGTMLDCDIAFVDEVFKGTKGARAALLEPLADRQFSENGSVRDIPLLSMFSASNELPASTDDAAFYSRIQLRFKIDDLSTTDSRSAALWEHQPDRTDETLSRDEVLQIREEVFKIGITQEACDAACKVFETLDEMGVSIDQRKRNVAMGLRGSLSQAQAWMSNREKIQPEDMRIAAAVFWNKPKDIKDIEVMMHKICSPKISAAQERYFEAVEMAHLEPLEKMTMDQLGTLMNLVSTASQPQHFCRLKGPEKATINDLRGKVAKEIIKQGGKK